MSYWSKNGTRVVGYQERAKQDGAHMFAVDVDIDYSDYQAGTLAASVYQNQAVAYVARIGGLHKNSTTPGDYGEFVLSPEAPERKTYYNSRIKYISVRVWVIDAPGTY